MRLLVLLLLGACSSVFQDVNIAEHEYRRSMELKVNGLSGVGVMVVPSAPAYNIFGHIHGTAEAIFIDTCNREVLQEDKGEVNYVYKPLVEPEADRACPLEIVALDKGNKHALAVIDFEDARHTLPSTLRCNGVEKKFNGVSICQAGSGMVQVILFPSPVIWEPGREECRSIVKDISASSFELRPTTGICTVVFQEVNGDQRKHRLSIIGFDRNILQEF